MTANFRLSGNQQPFHSPYSVSLTSSDPYTLSFTPWWRHRDLGGTTRDQLLQDVVILATFAAQQRFIDPESGFSRPRTGLKYHRTGGRRPTIRVPLEKGGFRCSDDPTDASGYQRSSGLLDAFAVIFAGSGAALQLGASSTTRAGRLNSSPLPKMP